MNEGYQDTYSDPNQIYKITSAKSRLEFMSTQFVGREEKSGDSRVLINLQEFDASKEQGSRVIGKTFASIRFPDFLALVSYVESGALATTRTAEMKRMADAGEKYGRNIWESRYGGGRLKNGEVVSRRLAITLATQSRTAEYIVVATETPGEVKGRGAILPKEGAKPSIVVRVPISYLDLLGALLLVRIHIQAFIAQSYSSPAVLRVASDDCSAEHTGAADNFEPPMPPEYPPRYGALKSDPVPKSPLPEEISAYNPSDPMEFGLFGFTEFV